MIASRSPLRRPALPAIALLIAAAPPSLTGCGPAASTGGAAKPASSAGSGAACRALAARVNPVRAFCDGPASIDLAIDGHGRKLTGGSCEQTAGLFAFNVGLVVLTGPDKPDYVGLTTKSSGAFSDAVLSLHLDGRDYRFAHNSGTFDGRIGTIAATGYAIDRPDQPVTLAARIDCGAG